MIENAPSPMMYPAQVCDIQDKRCQAVLRGFETDIYTPEDGFYSNGASNAVRKVMSEQCRDLIDRTKGYDE